MANLEEVDYCSAPIAVTDASSMLRQKIRPNMRPYTAKVVKLNNRLVDDWEREVLKKAANAQGTIPAGRVWSSWKLYHEGKGIHNYSKVREMVPRPTAEQLAFWIAFFEEKTLEELHSYGVGVISFGWSVIENEFRLQSVDSKWDKVFRHTEDPREWEKLAVKNQKLLDGGVFPFWDQKTRDKIAERVGTLFRLQVSPDFFRQRLTANMKPYTKVVAKLNNQMVSEWERLILGKPTKRLSIPRDQDWMLWSLWQEGRGLKKYVEIKDMLPRPTQEQLKFWTNLLEKSTIEELHARGMGVVTHAWKIVQTEMRMWVAEQKWGHIFSHGDDLKTWGKMAVENQDLMEGKILPFWDEKTLKIVSEKAGTILSLPITAEN